MTLTVIEQYFHIPCSLVCRLYSFGLITYVYYACKLCGLSAFSGERDSLLRCVGGVGEAGASYMNK